MPAEMIDGDGYPPLTEEVKADILGRNYARSHDIDIDAALPAIAEDELSRIRQAGLAGPWSRLTTPGQPDPLVGQVAT